MIRRKKIKGDLTPLINKLRKKLREEKEVLFAYIIGSYATGKNNPMSDFDIALYLEDDKDIFERKLYFNSLITDILKTDEVDIIILNNSSPFFVHHALKNAKLLFSKNEEKRISFLVKNLKEYFDMEYYYQRFKESILKRIEEGKYGI